MALMCPILKIFKGDRKNPMYIKSKHEMFMRGATCSCGAEITETSCDKEKCDSTDVLENHNIFPTFSLLDRCKNGHWAYIVEINEVVNTNTFWGFTPLNEMVFVGFYKLPATTFSFSDFKPGNTAIILYAKQNDEHKDKKLVVVENVDTCIVIKASFLEIQKEAECLINSKDSLSENKSLNCFTCNIETSKLMQCTACKLAKYCSKECQKKSWDSRHKYLCKYSEVLLRLACLPRHQDKSEPYSFDMNKNPLPSYSYKAEFVAKEIEK